MTRTHLVAHLDMAEDIQTRSGVGCLQAAVVTCEYSADMFCSSVTHNLVRFAVVESPSPILALTNCLVVHPNDFMQKQHVLVKHDFALTVV